MIHSFTQIRHLLRNVKQRLQRPVVSVVGGYHGGNLGDMALGESVMERLHEKGISAGMQTIYNLEKWPKTRYSIMGGGAIGYVSALRKLAARHKGYDRLAILGVDFPEAAYPGDCIGLLNQAPFVSCRSQDQAGYLQYLTGGNRFRAHPDLVFSFQKNFCANRRNEELPSGRQKILLVNVLPLFGYVKNNRILPAEGYRQYKPSLYDNFDAMHANYRDFISGRIDEALAAGWLVQTIAFTPADAVYARLIISNPSVQHLPYDSSPLKMLSRIAAADQVVATRLHATIFALKLGKRLTPIAYAEKNELLFAELEVPPEDFYTSEDFALGRKKKGDSIFVSPDTITQFENESEQAIDACISALKITG